MAGAIRGGPISNLKDLSVRLHFPSSDLSVHVNMSESNGSQDRPQSKPKRHNAKFCPTATRERIVNALAAGDPKYRIAKALRISENTISAIAEQEWRKVEERKTRLAAQWEQVATRAVDQLNEHLETSTLPPNVLVPIAGVATDKVLALRSEPTLVARIDHHHTGNIFHAFAKFHDEAMAIIKAKLIDSLPAGDQQPPDDSPPTAQQLALPNCPDNNGHGNK
jgi:hypothetical protein